MAKHNKVAPDLVIDAPAERVETVTALTVVDASPMVMPPSRLAAAQALAEDNTLAQAENARAIREALIRELPPDKFAQQLVSMLSVPAVAQVALRIFTEYVGIPVPEAVTKSTRTSLNVQVDGNKFSPADMQAAMAATARGVLPIPKDKESPPG